VSARPCSFKQDAAACSKGPVIVISAAARANHDVDAIFLKPVDMDALLARSEEQLARTLEPRGTSKKFVPRRGLLRHRLAFAVALIVALQVSLNVFAGTKCSQFGDPQHRSTEGGTPAL